MSWNEEANSSFNQLKQALCNTPILKLPDMKKRFILRTYASDTGMGAMLLQGGNGTLFPVAFGSKKLSHTHMRYSVVERENVCELWDSINLLLYGQSFVVCTV